MDDEITINGEVYVKKRSKVIDKIKEHSYRCGYSDGFDEGYESVLSDHATRQEMDILSDKILDWVYSDCSEHEDPPKFKEA